MSVNESIQKWFIESQYANFLKESKTCGQSYSIDVIALRLAPGEYQFPEFSSFCICLSENNSSVFELSQEQSCVAKNVNREHLTLIPPKMRLKVRADDETELRFMFFEPSQLERVFEQFGFDRLKRQAWGEDAYYHDLTLTQIVREFTLVNPLDLEDFICQDQMFETFSLLLARKCFRVEHHSNRKATQELKTLKSALSYVDLNLSETITIKSIAEAADIETYMVYRLFRKHLKTPPYQYVLKRRLEQAKRLLGSTQKSSTEISYTCGFSSPSRFFHCFKLHAGTTPSEFRESNQRLSVV